ncbi:MAG: hypothetical protein NZT61_02425 [Deltaproteobacteria bacterium]|nr:hypothetical protein [Deltaproteobacteria bacterium]MCX7952226.1 hypothetical protein [Deltaproteobacteria bacterium]
MALRFKLKRIAETYIDYIECPSCGHYSEEIDKFTTELTRVTFEGIVVVCRCGICGEIFLPRNQRIGVISFKNLRDLILRDARKRAVAIYRNIEDVKIYANYLNAVRRGEIH